MTVVWSFFAVRLVTKAKTWKGAKFWKYTFVCVPFFLVKTYLLMERPEFVFDTVLFNITKSPQQYNNGFDTIKAFRRKKEKKFVLFFDDLLEHNQKANDRYFTGRRLRIVTFFSI